MTDTQTRTVIVSGARTPFGRLQGGLKSVSAPQLGATAIAGALERGGVPADAVRLQLFEAASNSLAAASKLPTEPTSLFFDRTGLSAGQTRWYWLRAVSAEGNVSALAGPVSATAL